MVRRKFSAQFKQQVIKECIETGSIAIVSRKHEIRPNVVSRWVRDYKKNGEIGPTKPKAPATYVTPEEYQQLLAEKKELEEKSEKLAKTLGEQTLEVAILRDLLKKMNPHLQTRLK